MSEPTNMQPETTTPALPETYVPIDLVGVLPLDLATGRFGISFDLDGQRVRLSLSIDAARLIARMVLGGAYSSYPTGTIDQSSISSGNRQADGSPQDGQDVYPPSRSSNA